jgi:hypothetical protein
MCGVSMGSLLSPIVVNLYIENFEQKAFDSYPMKLEFWVRYVDDTNVKWPHIMRILIVNINIFNSSLSQNVKP